MLNKISFSAKEEIFDWQKVIFEMESFHESVNKHWTYFFVSFCKPLVKIFAQKIIIFFLLSLISIIFIRLITTFIDSIIFLDLREFCLQIVYFFASVS